MPPPPFSLFSSFNSSSWYLHFHILKNYLQLPPFLHIQPLFCIYFKQSNDCEYKEKMKIQSHTTKRFCLFCSFHLTHLKFLNLNSYRNIHSLGDLGINSYVQIYCSALTSDHHNLNTIWPYTRKLYPFLYCIDTYNSNSL